MLLASAHFWPIFGWLRGSKHNPWNEGRRFGKGYPPLLIFAWKLVKSAEVALPPRRG